MNHVQKLFDFSPPRPDPEPAAEPRTRNRLLGGCSGTCDRSALEPGGFIYEFRKAAGLETTPVPPGVAYYLMYPDEWEAVTYQQLLEERKQKQRAHLERILQNEPSSIQPAWLWVFFIEGFIYGGWWCYITTLRGVLHGRGPKGNVHSSSPIAMGLMETFPLDLEPSPDNFYQWMERFAEAHPRKPHKEDFRKAGSLVGWTDGKRFYLQKPDGRATEPA